jgi:ABC-type uncharacterized transport system substrate-binding protein
MMRRREFITLLGGAAAAWPLAAHAQQAAMPVIGYLNNGSPDSDTHRLTGLRRGLNQIGYVEGRNLVIEYRWAANQADRLPALAAELVRRQVTVIVAAGLLPSLAAKSAATSIPIVSAHPNKSLNSHRREGRAVMALWWKRPEKPSLQRSKRLLTYRMKTATVP